MISFRLSYGTGAFSDCPLNIALTHISLCRTVILPLKFWSPWKYYNSTQSVWLPNKIFFHYFLNKPFYLQNEYVSVDCFFWYLHAFICCNTTSWNQDNFYIFLYLLFFLFTNQHQIYLHWYILFSSMEPQMEDYVDANYMGICNLVNTL